MSRARPALRVLVADADRPVVRLHRLIGQNPALRDTFQALWSRLVAGAEETALDAWCARVLELADVHAGPASLIAFWRLCEGAGDAAPDQLAGVAAAAAEICRHAGAAATAASLDAGSRLTDRRAALNPGSGWWRGLTQLAHVAPDCLLPFLARAGTVLEADGVEGLRGFIAAGVKAAGGDRQRLRAIFTLADEAARRLLARANGAPGFADLERKLKLFTTALWGTVPILRLAPLLPGQPPPRRASLADGVIRLPDSFPGVPPDAAPALYRAAVAHASAHLALTPGRMPVGRLKPLQLVLIGLIEDARIEALTMRRFPGLRRLWAPFHAAVPTGAVTATALLARLSRALFDPRYDDPHDFVAKGRALFTAATAEPEDAGLSRRIGGLLGNDLGQLRLQFNARTYVIEPAYRDDGLGLWDHADAAEAPPEVTELLVEAARPTQQDRAGAPPREALPEEAQAPAGRARPVMPDTEGVLLGRYPEWDRAQGIDRPDWVAVREIAAAAGDPRVIETALDRAPALRRRVDRLVRAARLGRPVRLRRQTEGVDLDIDAVLDAAVASAAGEMPGERVYRSHARRFRDLATLVLLDVSESTAARVPDSAMRVLDVERIAVALLAETMARLGDPFALLAFASAGRELVQVVRIKDFREPYGAGAKTRLAGLTPGLSTRLGAALRHAGREIATVRSYRKLILVLTDGEPSDIDVADPRDLIEDARRAGRALKAQGIDTFGVTFDPAGAGSGAAVFGRTNHMALRRIEDLPARLSELYFRLARR